MSQRLAAMALLGAISVWSLTTVPGLTQGAQVDQAERVEKVAVEAAPAVVAPEEDVPVDSAVQPAAGTGTVPGTSAKTAPADPVLYWTNGDKLPGRLLSAKDDRLMWKTAVFERPFELDINYLQTLKFPANKAAPPAKASGPIRFVTHDGDVFYGRLVEITDELIVIEGERHGRVPLKRKAIRSLRRLDNPSLIYVGPNGTEGWRTLRQGRSVDQWQVTDDGKLATNTVGAELFRDLKLPEVSEIDIGLSWKRKPGFLITFATPNAIRYSKEVVKLETWDDELVLQTLATNSDFDQLKTLTDDIKSIELRLLWNQRTGELSVYTPYGELLGKMTAGSDTGKGLSGLYIQSKGTDLQLDYLRVGSWNGAAPTKDEKGNSELRLVEGDAVKGRIKSFSEADQQIVLDVEGTTRRVKLDEVASVDFGEVKQDTTIYPAQLSYFDGTRLRGKLLAIADGSITLDTPYSDEPISTPLQGVREIRFQPTKPLPQEKFSHVLSYRGALIHGTLAAVENTDSVIGWKPIGSFTASPLPEEGPATISREDEKGTTQIDDEGFGDVLYLRNGDIVPARLLAIDEKELHVDTFFAESTKIPRSHVKAIEFNTKGSLPVMGFSGRGWVVTERNKGSVERKDKSVTFFDTATLGHRDAFRGNMIEFDAKWKSSSPSAVTICFQAREVNRISSPTVLVYFAGQQLVIRGMQGVHQQHAMMRPMKNQECNAKLRFSMQNNTLVVHLDGKEVFRQGLGRRTQNGNGLVFSVQSIEGRRMVAGNQNRKEMLTLSNLRVGRSGGKGAGGNVSDKDREYVLTIPRSRRNNPSTHVVIAQNGDLLRGRLTDLDESRMRFISRMDDISLERKRLGALVWVGDDPPAEELPEGQQHNIQAVLTNGAMFTISANRIENGHVVGQHSFLGVCRVPVSAILEFKIGKFADRAQASAYADWKLTPAKEPQFAGGTNPGTTGPNDLFGIGSPLVGQDAEDFTVALLDGKRFNLAEQRGKIVVLDFWATWCGPCVKAMPQLIKATESIPKDKLVFVAVNQQEGPNAIKQFLAQRGWEMTVALDRDGEVGRKFQVEAIPQTVIIGPKGKIQRLHIGATPNLEEELKKAFEAILKPAAAEPE